MADISDLTNAVTSTIAGALLTNFTTGASVLGYTMKVYTGWPMNDQLDTDLANADRQYLKNGTIAPSDYICHISVIAGSDLAINTTRFLPQTYALPTNYPTINVTVTATTASFSGTVTISNTVGMTSQVLGVRGPSYFYRPSSTDTIRSLTSIFASQIPTGSVVGTHIQWASSISVSLASYADQQYLQEVRRQRQTVRISVWTPTSFIRSQVAAAVDQTINAIRYHSFPDGSASGPFLYKGTYQDDIPASAHLWRRDLIFETDYPTVNVVTTSPLEKLVNVVNGNTLTTP